MKLDFHTHGKLAKKLPFSTRYTDWLFDEAREAGLDGLCLTEHFNTLQFDELYGYLSVSYTHLEEESSIYRVIRSGKPIYNEFQVMRAAGTGQVFNGVNTTIPIKADGKVIGVAEMTRWVDDEFSRKDIPLSLKEAGAQSERLYTVDDIITCSPQMKEIKERISRVAATDSSVLIYGKTGTGKELVAQSIHTAGHRKKNHFVSQNCAAIPETLLEGILFGTVRGELYRSGKPSRIV